MDHPTRIARVRRRVLQLASAASTRLGSVARFVARRSKVFGCALALGLGVLLVLALLRDWDSIDWSDYRVDFGLLAISLLPHALGLGLGALGWGLIVRQLDSGQRLRRSIRVYMLSNVGRNLPGGVWHMLARVYLHKHTGLSGWSTAAAASIELALAVWAGAATYAIGSLAGSGSPVIPNGWLLALMVCEGLLLLPPVFNRLTNWLVSRSSIEGRPPVRASARTIVAWIALYLVILYIGGLALFAVTNAVYPLGVEGLPQVVGAWGAAVVVGGLTFWIPFRLGIRDGVLALALSVHIPLAAAIIVAALWRVLVSLSELVWAGLVGLVGWLRLERSGGES
jgi:hypothetical protein